ncbi:15891_t:CDS:2 [Cetraspora pellucida]|uniref:15891_t:CDS:1 n=1 Tax=Cetraspora pellucida TaxID=1433469 RepID=A0A9N9A5V3_9GLOM|nr:15891_t:CDS:2 [Cetraspora pellucida]
MHLENEDFVDFPSSKSIETDQYDSDEDMSGTSTIRQRRPVNNNSSSFYPNFRPTLNENPFSRKFLLVIEILLVLTSLIGLIFLYSQVLFNNKAYQPNNRFQPNDGSQLNDDSQLNDGFQSNDSFNPNDGVFSIVKMANISSEKFSLLKIPATDELNELRFAVRNLRVVMEKSRIIINRSKPMSSALDELDKNIHNTVEELRKFQHKAEWFFWFLIEEVKIIAKEFEKLHLSKYDQNLSEEVAIFVHKRLKSLETQINDFHDQFQRVSYAIDFVQNNALKTRENLIEFKREAEKSLKERWIYSLISKWLNITDPIICDIEEELDQVNFIRKMLKDFDRNFIDFGDFLTKYRIKIREVIVKTDGTPTKPTIEYISYLKKAAEDLERQHSKLFSKESIGHDSM